MYRPDIRDDRAVRGVKTFFNVGPFQVLVWPRRRLWFFRGPQFSGAYRWIVYLWPIEVRRFR
jgi:hypothetical protein